MQPFHPDLVLAARVLRPFDFGPRSTAIIRKMTRLTDRSPQSTPDVFASLHAIPGGQTARVFIPKDAPKPMPALLWVHGGGFVIGTPAQDDHFARRYAQGLSMAVVAPTYRLAPDHPFPAALDDLYATLQWIHAEAPTLAIDPRRVAVGGASAGGGLAAGLSLMARDREELPVAFQLLVYPMLDDRTVNKTIDGTHHRVWTSGSNRFGWTSYLGKAPGSADVSPYAAPARAPSLAGLPPTWLGVGTHDLFYDEDVAYAQRLEGAGVPVDLQIVPGAFHGFDTLRNKPVSQSFFARQVAALRRGLAARTDAAAQKV